MNKRYIRRDLEYCVEVERIGGEDYEYEMLSVNEIPGFLPFQLERVNGREHLIYTYTGYGLFEDMYEESWIKGEQIYQIVDSILVAIDSASRYLLNPNHLVLAKEHLFIDKKDYRIYFLYVPGYDRDIRDQLREFMDFLSRKIDKNDAKGVLLAWQILLILKEPTSHLEELRECLKGYPGEEKKEEKVLLPKERKAKIKKKKSVWMYLLVVFGGITLLLIVIELYILFHIYFYGIAEWKRNLLVFHGIFLAISVGLTLFFFRKERTKRQIDALFNLNTKEESPIIIQKEKGGSYGSKTHPGKWNFNRD